MSEGNGTDAIAEDRQFGPYNLVKKMAAGGMAEVWEARKTGVEGFEKRVAVKLILPHHAENAEFVEMFLDEGRIAANLDHPNVCAILDLGEAEGTFYIAMEFIDGVVLSQIMKESARRSQFIPPEHCVQIIMGACGGLDYAHSRSDGKGSPLNLVHRDISPQNVMVSNDGNVKVVDFGIAKAANQLHETRAGVFKGKYAYMSPEQATGKKLDRRSDIFALGVVLWEMVTGRRLFKADNEIATLHKIIGGDYDRPSDHRPDLPPALEAIIMKALAQDAEDRFLDCGEMQLALEDFLLGHGMAAGPKRLGYYIRSLMSGEEMPDLPRVSSVVDFMGGSDSGVRTPSPVSRPTGQYPMATPAPGVVPHASSMMTDEANAATAYAPVLEDQSVSFVGQRRSGAGLWIAIVLVALIVVGGLGFVFKDRLLGTGGGGGGPLKVRSGETWVVRTTPSGAQITVNSRRAGRTPTGVKVSLNKRMVIRISKTGYEPYLKTFRLTAKDLEKGLTVTLKKDTGQVSYGRLILKVTPKNSIVVLEDKRLKPTFPGLFTVKARAGRQLLLVASAKGYKRYLKSDVMVKPDSQRTLNISLTRVGGSSAPPVRKPRRRPRRTGRYAHLSVFTRPAGATVFINNRQLGRTTPVSRRRVKAGSVRIRVAKSGHLSQTRTLVLGAGESESINIPLPRKEQPRSFGKVSIGARPKSWVYVDGRQLGMTPLYNKSVRVGTRRFEFRAIPYGVRYRTKLTVVKGKQKLVHRFKWGRLHVLTRPQAKIRLPGGKLGMTNRAPYKVPAGRYRITLVFPNGKRIIKNATVSVGGLSRIKHKL